MRLFLRMYEFHQIGKANSCNPFTSSWATKFTLLQAVNARAQKPPPQAKIVGRATHANWFPRWWKFGPSHMRVIYRKYSICGLVMLWLFVMCRQILPVSSVRDASTPSYRSTCRLHPSGRLQLGPSLEANLKQHDKSINVVVGPNASLEYAPTTNGGTAIFNCPKVFKPELNYHQSKLKQQIHANRTKQNKTKTGQFWTTNFSKWPADEIACEWRWPLSAPDEPFPPTACGPRRPKDPRLQAYQGGSTRTCGSTRTPTAGHDLGRGGALPPIRRSPR